jgi:predicted RNase H-like nuclease (RuvC/YqgF family)
MNTMVQQLFRMITGLWYQHRRELDERDERITDLEMIISNKEHELRELRSQLDQYQSIFSAHESLKKYRHIDHEHHRSGVSAPPSTLCTLVIWPKSDW